MDTRQRKIYEWLNKHDKNLSELYEGALCLNNRESFPAKNRLIAHCLREIGNRLPEAVSVIVPGRVEYTKLVNDFFEEWSLEYSPIVPPVEGVDKICISFPLAQKINNLVDEHKKASHRNIEKARRLFHALDSDNITENESLFPLIRQWTDEGGWFTCVAHGGTTTDQEIGQKLLKFEEALLCFIGFYFEGHKKICEVIEKYNVGAPTQTAIDEVLSLLGRGNYRIQFFTEFTNPEWFETLKKSHFFKTSPAEGRWIEGCYLKAISNQKPEQVLDLIKGIKASNPLMFSQCLDCLLEMPTKISKKGIEFIRSNFQEKRKYTFYWEGEKAALIMIKLAEANPESAFAIAGLLLEVWVSNKEDSFGSRDVCMRFNEHDYAELIEKFYKQLWEQYPYRAFELLVQNLDAYLNEVLQRNEFDTSKHYYIMVENIEEGGHRRYQDFISIYMGAMRDCLNFLIEHESEAIDKTLELLRDCDKAVFTRFEIYLLSKIGAERHKDRVNEIASTKNFFEYGCYMNEYDMLIVRKKELLTPETQNRILDWIEQIDMDDPEHFREWFKNTYEKDCTEEDIRRFKNLYRAQRLYPLQDAFPEEFAKYKELSNADEEDLKPTPMHSEARCVAGDEGTPLTLEQMNAMTAAEAMDYVLTPEHYNYKPKFHQPNSPEEALGYVFKMAVKARPVDFINADIEKITALSETFISRFYYGLWDALRENKREAFDWDRFIKVAQAVVDKHKNNLKTALELRPLIECIQLGFEKTNKIDYTVERLDAIFSIAESLLSIREERDISNERDPIQIRSNSVTGEALMVCLSLGVIFKRDFREAFEEFFKAKLETVFHRILAEIKTPWTVCTFGSDFPRIFWLVSEWVERNLDAILSDNHWDTVWGTYLHWGRPSKALFKFLCGKGIYSKAIVKKDSITSRGSDNKPAEELAKHFVIAYFNGWIDSYDEPIFQEFIKAASDELLGSAAHFFTTGFERQKKEPDTEANERLATYWRKRLEVIASKPEGHLKEASELAYWIKNCPLDVATAFDLAERTLALCDGRFEDNYRAAECIKALCSYADGDNRIRVIRLIRLIVKSPPGYMYWDYFQDELSGLLNAVVYDETANAELIREAMGLADDLGRHRVFFYRDKFEELSRHIESMPSEE